jgi:transposase
VKLMLADDPDVVLGVDTHRDRHALVALDARTGALLGECEVPADPAGYATALAWASAQGAGRRAWGIEGTGAYGAGLARHLAGAGEAVRELDRPGRHARRRAGKSDRLDALTAARALLAGQALATPRGGAQREALRVLMVARAGAVAAHRAGLNQLKGLVVTAPEPLRGRLRGLGSARLVRACGALRRAGADPALGATRAALAALARRIRALEAEAAGHERAIAAGVAALCPALLAEVGVGPICAAQLLISYSHPGRLRSEAAFARLGGVAPIPASSGQTVRNRLHRGGDRQLNRALHTIVLCRIQRDPATKDYMARRVGEGKSRREAMRCLKRYVARQLYRLMEASMAA